MKSMTMSIPIAVSGPALALILLFAGCGDDDSPGTSTYDLEGRITLYSRSVNHWGQSGSMLSYPEVTGVPLVLLRDGEEVAVTNSVEGEYIFPDRESGTYTILAAIAGSDVRDSIEVIIDSEDHVVESVLELRSPTPEGVPNPFDNVRISYDLVEAVPVTVHVLDARLDTVTTLVNASQPAGSHSIEWNGIDDHGDPLPGGLYWVLIAKGEAADAMLLERMEPVASPDRNTISNLLEEYFEYAYSRGDSASYESLLDDSYLFEAMPNDPDEPTSIAIWGKEEELMIAGRMFSGWANREGIRVVDIDIGIELSVVTVDNTDYPGKPEGEDWYLAQTTVELIVVASNPNDPDGSGITNYIVDSFQDFVCRPDPGNPSLFTIARQFDRPAVDEKSGAIGVGTPRTEDASWGNIKSLFR